MKLKSLYQLFQPSPQKQIENNIEYLAKNILDTRMKHYWLNTKLYLFDIALDNLILKINHYSYADVCSNLRISLKGTNTFILNYGTDTGFVINDIYDTGELKKIEESLTKIYENVQVNYIDEKNKISNILAS